MRTAREPTLTEALSARGFSHQKSTNVRKLGTHDVFNEAGELVFQGTVVQAWAWLHWFDEQQRQPR